MLLDDTDPEMILSFFRQPHRLVGSGERDQVREALRRLTAMDLLRAEASPGILYVEGESDLNLLAAWARVLKHPLHQWFANHPFWHANQGRHPQEARGHFFALRALRPQMRGVLLLDGDNRRLPEHEVRADGLEVLRWERYESEGYLVHPTALLRFLQSQALPLFGAAGERYLRDELPPAVYRDPLQTTDYLRATPASKTLLPKFFEAAQWEIGKKEFYLVAEQMRPDEIAQEVREKLDGIRRGLGLGDG